MLRKCASYKLKQVRTIIYFCMSRNFHQHLSPRIPGQFSSPASRHQISLHRRLREYIKQNNKQKCDLLLDHQFYNRLENPKSLSNILDLKSSVAYYFRDYPMFLMTLENESKLCKGVDLHHIFLKKILLYMLSDHEALAKTVDKFYKLRQNSSILSVYLLSLSQLILGSFERGQQNLIKILNNPYDEFKIGSEDGLKLLDRQFPKNLNLRQQIFFNSLIVAMYKHGEEQTFDQIRPKDLYLKIKEGKKLHAGDFVLTDYQQFLNIWVSAKHDQPMEWVDLNLQHKTPYYRYLYMMAENSYMNKRKDKTNKLLRQLPPDYPLRQFLELSQLYDQKSYGKLREKFSGISELSERKQINYYRYPEYDVVILNMLKVVQKVEGKEEGIDVADEQSILFRYNANIRNLDGEGMPFYYLDIPFNDLMMANDLLTSN